MTQLILQKFFVYKYHECYQNYIINFFNSLKKWETLVHHVVAKKKLLFLQTVKKRHQQTNDLCDANSINTHIVSKQDVLFFQQNHLNQKDMDILSIGSE